MTDNPPTSQHPGCYAHTLGDCSSQLSREHYFSRAVLEQIHSHPIVEGLPGQTDDNRYSIASLTAKILCTRHNSMLSELDTAAAKVFKVIDEFEQEAANGVSPGSSALTIVSGRQFERWMLKVAFGLCKGKIAKATPGGVRTTSLRNEALLLRVLFNLENWPENWGLYLEVPSEPVSAPANLGFEPRAHPDTNELMMLVAWLRVVEFWLCLGKPESASAGQYRPGGLDLRESRSARSSKLLLSWPSGQHELFKMERVGQQDGWGVR